MHCVLQGVNSDQNSRVILPYVFTYLTIIAISPPPPFFKICAYVCTHILSLFSLLSSSFYKDRIPTVGSSVFQLFVTLRTHTYDTPVMKCNAETQTLASNQINSIIFFELYFVVTLDITFLCFLVFLCV